MVQKLSRTTDIVTKEDIIALKKIIQLVKIFTDKNPLRKQKINYQRIASELEKIDSDQKLMILSFKKVLRKLKSICQREIYPKIFFIVGGHGGIIIDGIGFCEFDSPKFAITRLLEKMQFAIETNMPYSIEIAMCCLEWLKIRFPKEMSEFLRLFKLGKFEIINPTYSQPYNLLIGPESNIKQFEYGLNILKQLGLSCQIYYSSECSLHPQIPQILKGFDIKYGSLRTRLLGMCPTTHSGHIDWVGLDNSPIETITDQIGIFNGEYWHGTFFKEIPNLLFQAVARPFVKYLVYSSIEDFIMHLPCQEEVWKISRFSEIFGKFIRVSDFFHLTEKDGTFKFKRDSFFLGQYVFIRNELFLQNKNCETLLIYAEILNCILGLYAEKSEDSLLDELWAKLLLTQAHDNYAVPYIRTGDYSAQQLNKEEYQQLKLELANISISDLSLQLLKKIQEKCNEFITIALEKLATPINTKVPKGKNPINILVFNPTITYRKDIISIPLFSEKITGMSLIHGEKNLNFQCRNSKLKFIAELSPLCYKIYSFVQKKTIASEKSNFHFKISILDDKKTIKVVYAQKEVFKLKFTSEYPYQLSINDYYKDSIEERYLILGKVKNQSFTLEIIQYSGINRLELTLHSNLLKELVLIPSFNISHSFINYPFGIEETKRTHIQTLDFLWLRGKSNGILFMIKNSQYFLINRDNFTIRNLLMGRGRFEFAISITQGDDPSLALNTAVSFQFRLVGIKLNKNNAFKEYSNSFLSISAPLILINLWRRKNQSYLRLFNPSDNELNVKFQGPLLKDPLKEINFNYKEIRTLKGNSTLIGSWKIQTFRINAQ